MRENGSKAFHLVLLAFCLLAFSSKAQSAIDLIDCENCLFVSNGDSLMQWSIDWNTNFKPYPIDGKSDLSIAIGWVQHKPDSLLETLIIQQFGTENWEYWDGQSWQNFAIPNIGENVLGIGATRQHLYMLVNRRGHSSDIFFYNGSTLKQCIEAGRPKAVGADIATDSLGRAWYLSENSSAKVDRINTIDSTGALVKSYFLKQKIGIRNIYGMTLLKDTILIGIGPTAPIFPSNIAVYVLKGDSAILSRLVPQFYPAEIYHDLTSSKPGIPDAIEDENPAKPLAEIFILPNPTHGLFEVRSSLKSKISLQLYNSRGQKVLDENIEAGEMLNIEDFANGSYIYHAQSNGVLITGVLVKNEAP